MTTIVCIHICQNYLIKLPTLLNPLLSFSQILDNSKFYNGPVNFEIALYITVFLFRKLSPDCQMLLFSATYDDDVMKFAQAVIPRSPIIIKLRREEESLDNIRQFYIECENEGDKFRALSNIYGSISIGQSIIFCAVSLYYYTLCKQSLEGYIGITLSVHPSVCSSVHVPCKCNSS